MSKIEVNTIEPQCGNTLTLGASGDTVTIPAGATISNAGTAAGFGSSGEISWDTTVKTADFTGVSGVGYFVNSASSTITVTLPASPSAGNVIGISSYNNSAATNAVTVARNGSNIIGAASDFVIAKGNSAVQLIYVDGTVGWQTVFTGSPADVQNTFISATGGTVTTTGDFKIHTFTSPGTFTVTNGGSAAGSNTVSYMVIGGGGSGGGGSGLGGGGGAGGFRELKNPVTPYTASPLDGYPSSPNRVTVTATAFPITVGAGGAAGGTGGGSCTPEGANATSGANSVFSTITAAGGGFGGNPRSQGPAQPEGQPGGSGGGGGGGSPGPKSGGTGNTPPTSPAQGTNGGGGSTGGETLGGSGGGATAAGVTSPPSSPPPSQPSRGTGATTSITGSPVAYSFGGSYGHYNPSGLDPSCAGATNTGNGGDATNAGPSGNVPASPLANYQGKAGGSGIVIIRYKYQ